MNLPNKPRVAVVGATGAVGRVMLSILAERAFPASEIVAVASARSAGKQIPFGDTTLNVCRLSGEIFEGLDLALFDTPDEVAVEWAPRAAKAGAIVVDNSGGLRMDPEVPLVVPEVNPDAALSHNGIIASPNCTTIGIAVPLGALHRAFGLRRVIVSSYQATSGAGTPGVEELAHQERDLRPSLDTPGGVEGDPTIISPAVFPAPIHLNVVPMIGSVKHDGFTSEETKMLLESRKIFKLPDLEVTATCVRVPTVIGHGASVYAEFEQTVDLEQAIKALDNADGVCVTEIPNPLAAAGTDDCYVGRIRQDPSHLNSLCFFTVSDNLRKGAALNAIQIAELLLPG